MKLLRFLPLVALLALAQVSLAAINDATTPGNLIVTSNITAKAMTLTNANTAQVGITLNAASGQTADLLDLNAGGVKRASFDVYGDLITPALTAGASSRLNWDGPGLQLSSAGIVSWSPGSLGVAPDLQLYRDAANTLAQRNGTTAQTLRVYNTYTDASNGEWGTINWADTANTFTIGTKKNGTGSTRPINLVSGGTKVATVSTDGIGSYATSTITTSGTGATNTLTANILLYVTAATGASLTDNAGTTEFSGVTIAAFTPIRLQPGGKFTGTAITYATGTASHAE